MEIIKLVEKEDNVFSLECDEQLIPLPIVEKTVNEVARLVNDRTATKVARDFATTKDGKALFGAYQEVKHLRFWNKVLYITNILTVLYFLWKGLN
ncbi:MAG: hypothetical protein K6G38_06400 [Gammaproteobacteria bacterium]|nr:hypothetical protein [Gammaproteobacteria bacterium]